MARKYTDAKIIVNNEMNKSIWKVNKVVYIDALCLL